MRELNKYEIHVVSGGIVHVIAGAVAFYYGEKAGKWLYKKIFN